MSICEIAQNFHNFCPKYIPPLSEFSHCFCPNFCIAFARISNCFCPNFGEKQCKFGQKQWEIWAKAMRKLGKRRHKFRAKIIAFARISHCLFPNFPLLLPEFSVAFFRISHCFCPNFPLLLPEFFVFRNFGGHSAPCPPPPTPAIPSVKYNCIAV